MSEPVRIKITPDSKMVNIPIGKDKEFESRVLLEVMFDVYTTGKDEDEAGAVAENIVDDIAKYLRTQLETADGLPSPSECWMASWGVRAIEIEESEDDDDGEV